jgi:uncharacterized protein with FMN-binding domain
MRRAYPTTTAEFTLVAETRYSADNRPADGRAQPAAHGAAQAAQVLLIVWIEAVEKLRLVRHRELRLFQGQAAHP